MNFPKSGSQLTGISQLPKCTRDVAVTGITRGTEQFNTFVDIDDDNDDDDDDGDDDDGDDNDDGIEKVVDSKEVDEVIVGIVFVATVDE